MDTKDFEIGDLIRHARRGSSYRIVDRFRADFDLNDEAVLRFLRDVTGKAELLSGDFLGEARTVMVQIDGETKQNAVTGDWFLYESLDEPDMAFIRPVVEFGGGRFLAA